MVSVYLRNVGPIFTLLLALHNNELKETYLKSSLNLKGSADVGVSYWVTRSLIAYHSIC